MPYRPIGHEARNLPDFRLLAREPDATEVLVLNAAFYRHEMHNKRPPPALCIDVPTYGMRLERTQPPAAFDAYNPERARIAHADLRDDSSDVLRRINVEQYDEILALFAASCPSSNVADRPKTSFCATATPIRTGDADRRRRQDRLRTEWWYSPQRLLARMHPKKELLKAFLDQHARPTVPFERERASSVEALHRMLQVLSMHFAYERTAVHRALLLMRFRAQMMACLHLRTHSVKRTLRLLAQQVPTRAPSPLVRIVRDGGSDELGQASGRTCAGTDSHAIMCTCKTLHAWGRQFSRQLQLQLVFDGCGDECEQLSPLGHGAGRHAVLSFPRSSSWICSFATRSKAPT